MLGNVFILSIYHYKKAFYLQVVVTVKQRLHQIEIEMSKIRSKQPQKEKDVKLISLLHSSETISQLKETF